MTNIFSVKNRLIFSCIIILLIPTFLIATVSFQSSKNAVEDQLQRSASENIELINQMLINYIDLGMKNVSFSSDHIIAEEVGSENESIISLLDNMTKHHPELENTFVGTEYGEFIISPHQVMPADFDHTSRVWYQNAMNNKGKVIISDPYISATTGNIVVTIAKTTKDGQGVVGHALSLEVISTLISNVKVGNKGYAFVLDKEGKYLVPPTDESLLEGNQNFQEINLFDKDNGMFLYGEGKDSKTIVFSTNELTDWKIAGTYYSSEVSEASSQILIKTLIILIISILLGAVMVFFIIKSITKPLNNLKDASIRIVEGDLTKEVDVLTRDEFGQLSMNFNEMVNSLKNVLIEVEKSSFDLTESSVFLNENAQNNSQASEQVAETIQNLAFGADDQARNIQESTNTIKDMSDSTEVIVSSTHVVSDTANQALVKALEGNEVIKKAVNQMTSIHVNVNELSHVVKGFGDRSNEISEIIQVITGIADETNLLALNAAIEASRAGEQGKGFAVVATEVRKLAEQSAESSKQITKLIRNIQEEAKSAVNSMGTVTKEVEEGIRVVNMAGESFNYIQFTISDFTKQIKELNDTVKQLSIGAQQVHSIINSVKEVAVSTAAGTQNVAAVTEEQLSLMIEVTESSAKLSDMAKDLRTLIKKYKF